MIHQYKTLEDTVYFWFAANDTSGSGATGATPVSYVRKAGVDAAVAPLTTGVTTTNLTEGTYPLGCHEVAVAATAGNSFEASETYAVFSTLAVDGQNPSGFVGSFELKPVEANATQVSGTAQTATDVGVAVLTNIPTAIAVANAALIVTDAKVDLIETATVTDIPALINALDDVTAAQVLTQVNAALDTAITELSVAIPAKEPSVRNAVMLMYMALRNQLKCVTSGSDALEIYNDAGTMVTSKALTDDGDDYTEAKAT